ncbi:MAG: tetratricopeptide repeat protein [Bacteroidetes bacterium MED-G17]|nr:MAG: tetratricopeptide repeat protein [Bacteroidetes bacterium MED-G17]|tara:strand:+ start:4998 stop:5324 length:327 start_codon:yes stop_codon:yes gene_type:complete
MTNRKEQIISFLKKEPNDAFLQYALSIEFLAENKKKEAMELLENILKNSPNYLPSYYQLGTLLYEDGEKNKALEVLKKGEILAKEKGDKHTLSELKREIQNIEIENYL